MLWPSGKLDLIFRNIKKNSSQTSCSVLILSAVDPDAVCATRTLTDLFKLENISYKQEPVVGLDDMLKKYKECIGKSGNFIRSIVTINCGGAVNLVEFFKLPTGNSSLIVYIMDSLRPFHHSNISSKVKNVIVLGEKMLEDAIKRGAIEVPSLSDDEDALEMDEEDLSTEEEESEEDEVLDGGVENKNELNDENIIMKPGASPALEGGEANRLKKRAKVMLKNQGVVRMRNYYEGNYHGDPVSYIAYNMASQLGKENNNLLWYSLVGLSYAYLHETISHERYFELYVEYKQRVEDQNLIGLESSSIAQDKTNIRIECIDNELRLFLYRHWTLWDAFYFSDYVMGGVGSWSDKGRENLEGLFASLGVSLKDAKQQYGYIGKEVKNELPEKIQQIDDVYELKEMTFPSFMMRMGYDSVSATDAAYSLSALCEEKVLHASNNNNNIASVKDREREDYEIRFNSAYDALKEIGVMNRGIVLCQQMQSIITNEGVGIVETKALRTAGDFRYGKIEATSEMNELFTRPSGLKKLVQFIARIQRLKWSGLNKKPLILGCLDAANNRLLMVGITCSDFGQVTKNPFTRLFRNVLKDGDIPSVSFHSYFDDAVVEINPADELRFLVGLGEVMIV